MESPTVSTLISSTTLSLLGVDATSSLATLDPSTPNTRKAPTTQKTKASSLSVAETKSAEEPLFKQMERNVEEMTQAELIAHVEMLRQYRKSPQTLSSKISKDELALDGEFGEPEAKKIRKAAPKTLEEKMKRSVANVEVKAAALASKWGNFSALPKPE